jgi:DNA-binding transcriptional LysR family regulator
MLNIHELEVFLAAAETENFSQAGRKLNISQPAVSMQIRALEDRLSMDLFHRSGRHIALTEAGRALVPMARNLLERAIQIEEAMASLRGEIVGQLRLGCSTTAGKHVLPRLLSGLREKHPRIDVACHTVPHSVALQMLQEGEIHAAFTGLGEPHKDVEYRPFLTDPVVLIAPPDHPWARSDEAIKLDDLLAEKNFILHKEESGTYQALKEGLAWHDLSPDHLNTGMVLGDSEVIRMAVQEGIGVAFVSMTVVAEAVQAGMLAVVRVEGLELSKTLYLARHTNHPVSCAQSAFWEFAFAPENKMIRQIPGPFVNPDMLTLDEPGASVSAETK